MTVGRYIDLRLTCCEPCGRRWPVGSCGKNYNEAPIPSHDSRPEFTKSMLCWTPVIASGNLMFYRRTKTFSQWNKAPMVYCGC